MKIISIISANGGVGKTTIAANLATVFKKNGHHVLAVDFDPKNSLRLHFGIDLLHTLGIASSKQILGKWSQAIIKGSDDVSILPFGNTSADERNNFIGEMSNNPMLLKEQLITLGLPNNAIVLVDTPAGPSPYLDQSLSAANLVILANHADGASYSMLQMINALVEQQCRTRVDFLGSFYVINQLDRSRQLAGDIADIMSMQLGAENVGPIHHDQSVQEAFAFGTDVIHYAPDSRASMDFIEVSLLVSQLIGIRLGVTAHRDSF
ncbi:cellulose synthase operon protein YhjQ [Polynucleobacter paneuropaeus]|jgi:cellulose synthase operon protein YhjQ|nr:cellulose synthase operon protein YhjQ [Polynucleobacter paneuropaeus]MBT8553852.1 cellulose synthase operon protein YhjQ [Polynucleobacter paneuropaeus]MBT8559130.1 cellulose synthase operon protein YhjQ [Polynucleobacter paneuropaeus]MBT8569298.1 cellulose synthase operon protein YhjQ [Polynucleobacter paneuropaeus]